MSHKRAFLVFATMVSAIVLAGFVGVSLTTGASLTEQYPNNQANHHPRHAAS